MITCRGVFFADLGVLEGVEYFEDGVADFDTGVADFVTGVADFDLGVADFCGVSTFLFLLGVGVGAVKAMVGTSEPKIYFFPLLIFKMTDKQLQKNAFFLA